MIRAAARRPPAVFRTIDVKRQRCSSIRPAIDGTRALFAPAATTPQNLTSGRRSSRPHQNSSYSRSRERKMQGFKSVESAQRFASIHAAVYNAFNVQRRLSSRSTHRALRAEALSTWKAASTARG
jgi:transposase-like protein